MGVDMRERLQRYALVALKPGIISDDCQRRFGLTSIGKYGQTKSLIRLRPSLMRPSRCCSPEPVFVILRRRGGLGLPWRTEEVGETENSRRARNAPGQR